MRALQYYGKEDLRFVSVPEPTIGEQEVLIKIKKVGICGTDLHIYHGDLAVPTPLTLGHEFVGEVAAIGSRVTRIAVGDRAVAEHVIGCGHCKYCVQGRKNLCQAPTVLGLHKAGALAEYMALPADLVYRLPEALSDDEGVLVEPLSIAVYAVRQAQVSVGDVVAVVGQGPIGLFVDQVCQAAGASVYGIDVLPARLNFARTGHYIEAGINPQEENPLQSLRKEGVKDGADVVFEVVGNEKTAQTALELANSTGRIIILGVFEHDVRINMMQILKKELMVQGSWTCLLSFEPTLNLLLTKKIRTEGLITHRYRFDDAVKAFEESSAYSDNRIKGVIEF